MSLYKFADLIVRIENRYPYTETLCKEYAFCQNVLPDIFITVSEEEIRKEEERSTVRYDKGYIESVCALRKIGMQLPLYDAILLHGVVIAYKGRGIAFLARSGVGKTTHMLWWKQVFDNAVTIINGDKPFVRFVDGVPYAYGTPWAGKEGFQTNTKVPLTDICFLERGTINVCEKLEEKACAEALLKQIFIPKTYDLIGKTLELTNNLLRQVNLYRIVCTNGPEAAQCVRDRIILDSEGSV